MTGLNWMIASMALAGTTWAAQAPPAGPAVVAAKVTGFSSARGVVALDASATAGVELGDSFWVLGPEGVVAGGTISTITANGSAGLLGGTASQVAPGAPAAVLRRSMLATLRDALPPGVTISGRIARVVPGRQTAWIDIGRQAGLRNADQVLVSRRSIPVARGRLTILEPDAALIALEPVVSNAMTEPGDLVELWPAPADARWGRLNSSVLKVEAGPDGPVISLVGTAADGLIEDQMVDVTRNGAYVGVASLIRVSGPISKGAMIVAASRGPPAEGDQAVVRSPLGRQPAPVTATVFGLQDQDCQIAAGEPDGVREGDRFMVRRQDEGDPTLWHDIAELIVQDPQANYSVASVRNLDSALPGLRLWDMAERQVPGAQYWRAAGIIERAAGRDALAAINSNSQVAVGGVVRWVPSGRAPGAAVIIGRNPDGLILHVPPGWGLAEGLHRARLDLPDTTAGGRAPPQPTPATRRAP